MPAATRRPRSASKEVARYSRRLSDKLLLAVHQACDQGEYEVARRLLEVLELLLHRQDPSAVANRRRQLESLVAAYERLWHLCNPAPD